MISVPEFTSASELRAHYRAVRERLYAPREIEAKKPAVRIVHVAQPTLHAPPRAIVNRSAVFGPFPPVRTFARMGALPMSSWSEHGRARRIIAEVAARHGLHPFDITGERVTRPIVNARHQAIVLVYANCPNLSFPQIGRLFERDHTSIMSAIRKIGSAWGPHQ